jgi:O-acetyl-ADP-ribose deacetylase (regulator of RNase III)
MTPSGIEPATYMDYVLSGILFVIASVMCWAINEFLHHNDCLDILIVQASNLFRQLFVNTAYLSKAAETEHKDYSAGFVTLTSTD